MPGITVPVHSTCIMQGPACPSCQPAHKLDHAALNHGCSAEQLQFVKPIIYASLTTCFSQNERGLQAVGLGRTQGGCATSELANNTSSSLPKQVLIHSSAAVLCRLAHGMHVLLVCLCVTPANPMIHRCPHTSQGHLTYTQTDM